MTRLSLFSPEPLAFIVQIAPVRRVSRFWPLPSVFATKTSR